MSWVTDNFIPENKIKIQNERFELYKPKEKDVGERIGFPLAINSDGLPTTAWYHTRYIHILEMPQHLKELNVPYKIPIINQELTTLLIQALKSANVEYSEMQRYATIILLYKEKQDKEIGIFKALRVTPNQMKEIQKVSAPLGGTYNTDLIVESSNPSKFQLRFFLATPPEPKWKKGLYLIDDNSPVERLINADLKLIQKRAELLANKIASLVVKPMNEAQIKAVIDKIKGKTR